MYEIFKTKEELERFWVVVAKAKKLLDETDVSEAEVSISGGTKGEPYELGFIVKFRER